MHLKASWAYMSKQAPSELQAQERIADDKRPMRPFI